MCVKAQIIKTISKLVLTSQPSYIIMFSEEAAIRRPNS